jgi:hypothetical protein
VHSKLRLAWVLTEDEGCRIVSIIAKPRRNTSYVEAFF